ncbi:MAG: PQQ-like beta-propeller repeat protein [Planctomycetaceae bacterium]|nr:PQQ-like beta-propeller repeat protein [Planctomycetaceae bacterium]
MRGVMVVILVAGICGNALADNWPHWRGDQGNGVSLTAKPPIKWSDTENVKWKQEIPGQSSGSPVIWENKLFVVSGVPADPQDTSPPAAGKQQLNFTLFCFEKLTGKLLWKQVAVSATPHEPTHQTNNFAAASPCTDGEHVYAHFGSRGLYCYTLDGKLVWKRNDFGQMETRNSFGEGSSPTIAGNMILVPWDHEGPSSLWALDKLTGETIWKVERDEPTCWATPLVIEHAGRQQVIMNGQNQARAYDLKTGEELWRCGGQTQRPVASAVFSNGKVYIGSGHRGSFLGAFLPDGQGDIAGTDKVLWTIDRDTPDIASPLLTEKRLYFYKAKVGVITCVDPNTGKVIYGPTRVPDLESIYASPIAANGLIYLTDRNGTTVVIRDADEFEVVATNSVGETVDATPAPVDNLLFIRGEKHLFCIENP